MGGDIGLQGAASSGTIPALPQRGVPVPGSSSTESECPILRYKPGRDNVGADADDGPMSPSDKMNLFFLPKAPHFSDTPGSTPRASLLSGSDVGCTEADDLSDDEQDEEEDGGKRKRRTAKESALFKYEKLMNTVSSKWS